MKNNHMNKKLLKDTNLFFRLSLFLSLMFFSVISFAQSMTEKASQATKESDEKLIDQYIQAKGPNIISFDAANIKQFWIDNSVISKDNSLVIGLNKINAKQFESIPLKIQLANVNETQDCKIEVISETTDLSFSVIDNKSKVLSVSKKENSFLGFMITSSLFHVEDTQKTAFYLKFKSTSQDGLSIKKIVLSFSENPQSRYLVSPGRIVLSSSDINTTSEITDAGTNSFLIKGKESLAFSAKRIIAMDNTLSSSITVKNTGDNPTIIRIGYGAYTRDNSLLTKRNYPYKNNNKVLTVLSSIENSEKIIVDSYTEWAKGCRLGLNASEDLSDIPNTSLAGTIIDFKMLENGQGEITLDQKSTKISRGQKVRVLGPIETYYVYTAYKILQPGEKETFTSSIKKDDSLLEYSMKSFSRGVYYVVPMISSHSVDPKLENTIQISNYSIVY